MSAILDGFIIWFAINLIVGSAMANRARYTSGISIHSAYRGAV